jgi:hypothetical protein
MNDDAVTEYEGAIDTLLIALAIQASVTGEGRFSEEALEYLVLDQRRATVRRLLGSIAHLVHYGVAIDIRKIEESLMVLFEKLLSILRRAQDSGAGELLPGDLVEIVVARPADHLEVGELMRVYYRGDDGTLDVGFESLVDDFVIHTVASADVQRRPASR